MIKFIFWTSLICSILVGIFMLTKISLNGYKTDFYFFIITLLLNLVSFLKLRKISSTKYRALINLSVALLQVLGLLIFLWVDTLKVDKVYQPINNKYNLYSSLTGWYKRSYFKPHTAELCGDGDLWNTKVPYYFPLIEIETWRDECHKVYNDSNYHWLYKHVPE